MSLEILIYVAVGILWLILQALGKKKKAQQQRASGQPQRPPVTLQDVLTDMEWIPSERPSTPDPGPIELRSLDTGRIQPVLPVAKPVPKPSKPALNQAQVRPTEHSALMDQLRDPQSAQMAVLVAEILGKPRAMQGPLPLSR